ncbi:hypothetical protein QAD02_016741 [Eretmocerus hayati]|uniref:Uncharacterized protein n=1 Tax=Eretmocerus hayati TaxID=131215 RepID=A0ACC2PCE4_9HYME|nr:hypothetical protein QAD02_016741 [Eretmocerus hayati]
MQQKTLPTPDLPTDARRSVVSIVGNAVSDTKLKNSPFCWNSRGTLNGAENSSVPGRVYKKVAIVENFFDIIHAVHVDLEGRPGKHAGQKRTYRTITETYAFLPREAVTRFLLGCTECQRRPRTPSPSTTATATPPPASSVTTKSTPTTENSDDKKSTETSHDRKTPTETVSSSPRSSPKPATAMSSTRTPSPAVPPKEACHPPESHDSPDRRPKDEPTTQATSCTSTITTSRSSCENKISNSSRMKDERYNPLSITNLLRKDPIPRRPPLPLILHQPSIMGPPCMVPSTTHLVEADAPSAFHKVVRTTPPLPAQAPCIPVSSLHCSAEAVARTLHYAVSNALQPLCPPMTTLAPTTTLLQTKLTTSTTTTAVPMSVKVERPVKEIENVKVKDEVKEEVAKTDNDLKDRAEVKVIEVVEKKDDQTKEVVEELTKNVKVEVKAEVAEQPQESFPPAAGLIDTNLNLLATIQQIHCQVMLALTQRLRSVPTLESLEQTTTAMNSSTFTMDSMTKSTITGNPESS